MREGEKRGKKGKSGNYENILFPSPRLQLSHFRSFVFGPLIKGSRYTSERVLLMNAMVLLDRDLN